MEFKGTKGVWGVGSGNMKDTGVDELVIYPDKDVLLNGGYRLIAVLSPISQVDGEDMANAHLIASAPDMLKTLIDIYEYGSSRGFEFGKIKKVINKALGKEDE